MQINYISNTKKEKTYQIPTEKVATSARILHTQNEFVIDFIDENQVIERIIGNPQTVKSFYNTLAEAIKNYEKQNGEIKIVKPKKESLVSEIKRNLFVGKRIGKNLRIINPKRRKK